MKIILFISMIIILFMSCSYRSNTENPSTELKIKAMERFNWLPGSWSSINSESQLYEIWTKENDTVLSGKSYVLVNNDTAFSETLRLEFIGQDLFYIPTIKDENNDQPVSFKLISDTNGEFIFENNEHDFPQRIIYKNSEPGILNARIEGLTEGKFQKEEFVFKKNEQR